MKLFERIKIPIEKAREYLKPGGGETEAAESQTATSESPQVFKKLQALGWRRLLALFLLVLGVVGAVYAASSIIISEVYHTTVTVASISNMTMSFADGFQASVTPFANDTVDVTFYNPNTFQLTGRLTLNFTKTGIAADSVKVYYSDDGGSTWIELTDKTVNGNILTVHGPSETFPATGNLRLLLKVQYCESGSYEVDLYVVGGT